jgi:cyclopropane fatty-acyl-phospholipid synthase-like methyltransferase
LGRPSCKSWEASAYFKEGQQDANWWDSLSTVFRGDAMYVRMSTALELAKPHINGATVLDVGCASGRFAFQMIESRRAKSVRHGYFRRRIGTCKETHSELGMTDKTEFSTMDVVQPNSPLPQVDLVTALGRDRIFRRKGYVGISRQFADKIFPARFPRPRA